MPVEQGVALENSTSTSQQDLQSYSQQPPMAQPPTATTHSPAGHHYIYQQPHSPVPPQSPVSCVVYFFQNLPYSSFNSAEKNRKKRTYETNRFYIHVYWFLLPVEVVANAATTTQLVGLVQVLAAGEQAVAAVVARANDSSKRVLAAGEGGQEEKLAP